MPRRNRHKKGMKEDMKMQWNEHGHCHNCWKCRGKAGGVYCLGFIGAVIYYIQTATGFWGGVLGVLKAIVWPAFLIYKLLGM